MRLFNRNKQPEYVEVKKPRRKKKPSDILEKTYMKVLNENPDLRTTIALKESGHYDEFKALTDPTVKQRQAINEIVTTDALSMIRNDPALRKQYAEVMAQQLIAGAGVGSNGHGNLSPAEELIENIRQWKELREELVGENGGEASPAGWASTIQKMIAQPEMASVFAGLMKQIFGNGMQPAVSAPQRSFVVSIDGKLTEVNESQYKQLISNGQIKPVGLIEAPKTEDKHKTEDKKTENAESKAITLPDWAQSFQYDTLLGYLELSPEEFINQLETEIASGEAGHLQMFCNFLMTADYDKLVEILSPYKSNETAGKFVSNLLEKRKWVEDVIKIIKDRQIGG